MKPIRDLPATILTGRAPTVLALAAVLSLACAVPGTCEAGPAQTARPAGILVRTDSSGAIPMPGIETAAPRTTTGPSLRLRLHVGDLTATLAGEGGVAPFGGPVVAETGARARSPWWNEYAGAALDLDFGGPGTLALEGGRVTLHDPLDVVAREADDSRLWTTSAGVVVRF